MTSQFPSEQLSGYNKLGAWVPDTPSLLWRSILRARESERQPRARRIKSTAKRKATANVRAWSKKLEARLSAVHTEVVNVVIVLLPSPGVVGEVE